MKKHIARALKITLVLTALCGVIFPLTVFGISQLTMHDQANGEIIEVNGVKYGSVLVAQQFTSYNYLWGRIMLIDSDAFYDYFNEPTLFAFPSNIDVTSEAYATLLAERAQMIADAHPTMADTPIPYDLVTVSGSGMDPDVTVPAAEYQIDRIAASRGIEKTVVADAIKKNTTGKFLGLFGNAYVNVLLVNLTLDGIIA